MKFQPVRYAPQASKRMLITIDNGTWQAADKSGTYQNALSLKELLKAVCGKKVTPYWLLVSRRN